MHRTRDGRAPESSYPKSTRYPHPRTSTHTHAHLVEVWFDAFSCVGSATFSQRTMDGKVMSVDDSRLMSVAITNHTPTTAPARRNLSWTQQEASASTKTIAVFCERLCHVFRQSRIRTVFCVFPELPNVRVDNSSAPSCRGGCLWG